LINIGHTFIISKYQKIAQMCNFEWHLSFFYRVNGNIPAILALLIALANFLWCLAQVPVLLGGFIFAWILIKRPSNSAFLQSITLIL